MAGNESIGYFVLFFLLLLIIIYFLPTIIANHRNHRNKLFIAILNLFLGWTLLGWLAFLIWSLNGDIVRVEPKAENLNIK